jgi:MFS family permease
MERGDNVHVGTPTSMPPGYKLLIGCLTAGSMLGTAAISILPALAPVVARSYDIPAVWIGYQFSLVALFLTLSLLFLGNASRRWGPLRVVQCGIGLNAVALALVLVPSLWALGAASACMGVGYGMIMPANSHLMMRFTPRDKLNRVFSIQQTGIPLGAILAASGAPVVAVAFDWQTAVAALAVLVAVLAVYLQTQRARWDDDRDSHAQPFRNPFAGLGIVVKSKRLRNLSASGFCFSGAQFCLGTYLVVALVEELGYGLVQAGIVLSLAQFTGVVCRVYCGVVADRTGDSLGVLIWLTLGMTISGFAVLGMDTDWPLALVCVLFAVQGAASIGWPGTYLAEVGRLAPAGQVSMATSGSLLFTNVGKMTAPLVFVAIQGYTGSYATAFGIIGVLGVLGTLALMNARRLSPSAAAIPS